MTKSGHEGDELRTLRELKRGQEPKSAFVFTSERPGPMTFSNVAQMLLAASERAHLPPAHSHMLRHTAGPLLADAGHDTRRLQLRLGHMALPDVVGELCSVVNGKITHRRP
jgi:site-specific recombinase XerD